MPSMPPEIPQLEIFSSSLMLRINCAYRIAFLGSDLSVWPSSDEGITSQDSERKRKLVSILVTQKFEIKDYFDPS